MIRVSRNTLYLASALATAALFGCASSTPESSEEVVLEQGFAAPPNSARPRVWWHWMNGNISEEGIRSDIEWMSRVGIGGLQNFDAALTTPQIVDERLVYMTPEWKQAFRLAAQQVAEHDMELAVAGSPGWSETGGPWVAPEDAMKKLVWSEVILTGGERFNETLPPLPQQPGTFQDIGGGDLMSLSGGGGFVPPEFSRDTLVLAYPLSQAAVAAPTISLADGSALDAELLSDGRYTQSESVVKGSKANPTVIRIDYDKPQTVRALTMFLPLAAGHFQGTSVAPVLESSRNGQDWVEVSEIPVAEVPSTVSFPAVTAQHFRAVLKPVVPQDLLGDMGAMAPGVDGMSMMSVFGSGDGAAVFAAATKDFNLAELKLHREARVDEFELKAGYLIAPDYYALAPTEVAAADSVPVEGVIDLSDKIAADGTLDWTPPAGNWKVLRLGYSLTGKVNHPAPPEATGLEVDKFDGGAVRRYMEAYLDNYRDATGEGLMGETGLQALLTDSIEVGAANWTPAIIEQFKGLRGYDPTPWLPALTGAVVGSGEQSDKFLYDYRRTLADLIASEHYGVIADVTEEYGLTYYSEAVESIRTTLGDDIAMRSHADIPMAAFWTYGDKGPTPVYELDIKGAASTANLYGQNLVAAESLTSVMQPWTYAPAQLRPMIDLEFARGVNRPVIHTSVHQPADDKFPGLALLIFGQYFNRHETWAEMAGPWVDYIARSSFLLQQGRSYADVAYFYGEEAPLTMMFKDGLPEDAPERYAFDFINADALRDITRVEGGELLTTGGARYKVLYLGGSSRYITLPVLQGLAELVEQGVTVVGYPPQSSPSLADDAEAFNTLRDRLWGHDPDTGKGQVIASDDVEAVLASLSVTPDFVYEKSSADSKILFQHRRLENGEIYFLSNRSASTETGELRFRVTGKQPELWRADSGETRPLSFRTEGEHTVIDVDMAPQDAFFIVFRAPAPAPAATFEAPRWQSLADISEGPWQVSFQEGRGAPATARFDSLEPLNEHGDSGIKYFSGVATYSRVFELPEGAMAGAPLQVDLGDVAEVAEVYVNGEKAGTAWREPFRVDISEQVQAGRNTLEIRVANLWVNRLIGDAQEGADKITWTSTPVYLESAPLRESGLKGPVRLLGME